MELLELLVHRLEILFVLLRTNSHWCWPHLRLEVVSHLFLVRLQSQGVHDFFAECSWSYWFAGVWAWANDLVTHRCEALVEPVVTMRTPWEVKVSLLYLNRSPILECSFLEIFEFFQERIRVIFGVVLFEFFLIIFDLNSNLGTERFICWNQHQKSVLDKEEDLT